MEVCQPKYSSYTFLRLSVVQLIQQMGMAYYLFDGALRYLMFIQIVWRISWISFSRSPLSIKIAWYNIFNKFWSPYKFLDIFSKFLGQSHFLEESGSYVYKMDDLTQEDIFLKRQRVSLYKALGYARGVTPSDAVLKN